MTKARKEYRTNKNSYQEIFNERDKKLKRRQIYWVDKWDRQMSCLAIKFTQREGVKGNLFPANGSIGFKKMNKPLAG